MDTITTLTEFEELYGTKFNPHFDLGYFAIENSMVLLNDEEFNLFAKRTLPEHVHATIEKLTGFIIAKKGYLGKNISAEFLILRQCTFSKYAQWGHIFTSFQNIAMESISLHEENELLKHENNELKGIHGENTVNEVLKAKIKELELQCTKYLNEKFDILHQFLEYKREHPEGIQ